MIMGVTRQGLDKAMLRLCQGWPYNMCSQLHIVA